ncbi:hypothetical protein F9C07_1456410 [Aspergillus flavus]|uniref:Uncharacterized protein n=1 Tax=Aspergillus flavus (strain ATCC 200026 / FGSC A1120 / IAM 13836 / NRRL 3357 / JCM 12722 / SRRC 167) TaxID=332952 RepID=A0A7U2MMN9_ASPFN|nr:hypothetical protein F9C07_1456410 [Aspergillus flavus]
MPMKINQKKISNSVGALCRISKRRLGVHSKKQTRKGRYSQDDCTGFQATWRDCRSLGCKIKASYMCVPGAIRRVRYRFGPFPPPLPGGGCSWYSGCSQYTEESTLPLEAEQYMERSDTSPEDLHSPLRSDHSILSTPEQVAPIREPNTSPQFTAKDLTRICLVVIIMGLIIALIFRTCRNTCIAVDAK